MEYGEYAQKESMASWLAAYRFLFKSSPCTPEAATRMAQLSEFERPYSHVLMYLPQLAAMVEYDGRQGILYWGTTRMLSLLLLLLLLLLLPELNVSTSTATWCGVWKEHLRG